MSPLKLLPESGIAVAAVALLAVVACGNRAPGPETRFEGVKPDASVTMEQVQAAYIGSAGGGSGTLTYQGAAYPFTVVGVGVGGVGVSKLEATGDVYSLPSVRLFPGTYAQGRYGFAIGNMSGGDLWLQNQSGVVMHLKAKRQGLMLSLGGDAVLINMNQ